MHFTTFKLLLYPGELSDKAKHFGNPVFEFCPQKACIFFTPEEGVNETWYFSNLFICRDEFRWKNKHTFMHSQRVWFEMTSFKSFPWSAGSLSIIEDFVKNQWLKQRNSYLRLRFKERNHVPRGDRDILRCMFTRYYCNIVLNFALNLPVHILFILI